MITQVSVKIMKKLQKVHEHVVSFYETLVAQSLTFSVPRPRGQHSCGFDSHSEHPCGFGEAEVIYSSCTQIPSR